MHSAYPDYVYRFSKDKIYWPEFIHSMPKIEGNIFKIDKNQKSLAMEHLANDSILLLKIKTIFILPQNFPKDSIKTTTFKLLFSPFAWF